MVWRRLFKKAAKRRWAGAPGKRCYAVGDVHGRADLLDQMLGRIEADHAGSPPKDAVLVFLGDLIDRGPDSRGVIDRLMNRPPAFARMVILLGNHEEMLIRGLSGEPELLTGWLSHGGYECAQSYGAPVGSFVGAEAAAIEAALRSHIPADHIAFMKGFADSVVFGDYLFVHAGVRPGVPVEEMGRDVRWIREGFLDSAADFGRMVIHGHTVTEQPDVRPNRIGIDTGAYKSGILTALRIEDESLAFLQTVGGD